MLGSESNQDRGSWRVLHLRESEESTATSPLPVLTLLLGAEVALLSTVSHAVLPIVCRVGRCAIASGYKLWGVQYSPRETAMARVIHIFFVSKIYEFMDTFIMLLKGNVQQVCGTPIVLERFRTALTDAAHGRPQVTVLHVYHHATISFIWWMITYTAPGGDAYFSAALNSFVVRVHRKYHSAHVLTHLVSALQHVLMYTYYLMAILLGKDPKVRTFVPAGHPSSE